MELRLIIKISIDQCPQRDNTLYPRIKHLNSYGSALAFHVLLRAHHPSHKFCDRHSRAFFGSNRRQCTNRYTVSTLLEHCKFKQRPIPATLSDNCDRRTRRRLVLHVVVCYRHQPSREIRSFTVPNPALGVFSVVHHLFHRETRF